ncbi:MAG: 2-amino-4-hydroxy-6-hydroxymethyldihydropteridine diphosphokinase [Verrucomicrobiales bacterium]|jgi:2-amino-4-hydroxy-6-hydroxymethyldihydropteridine diphosphokinase
MRKTLKIESMKLGIALGSNLGDRLECLKFGRARLVERLGEARSGGVYETEPVDCPPGSPAFLNTVVEVESDLEPLALLDFAQQIEREAGRTFSVIANAPRPLDLDLLYFGDLVLNSPRLTLPHPRLHLRRFVLIPLADISPDLIPAGQTQTVQQLLTDLEVEEPDPICVCESW